MGCRERRLPDCGGTLVPGPGTLAALPNAPRRAPQLLSGRLLSASEHASHQPLLGAAPHDDEDRQPLLLLVADPDATSSPRMYGQRTLDCHADRTGPTPRLPGLGRPRTRDPRAPRSAAPSTRSAEGMRWSRCRARCHVRSCRPSTGSWWLAGCGGRGIRARNSRRRTRRCGSFAGLDRRCGPDSGRGRADTRNLMPRRCTAERTAISGFVSRLRFPCIDLRVADDEAQDSFPEPAPTHRTVMAERRWRRRQRSVVPPNPWRSARGVPLRASVWGAPGRACRHHHPIQEDAARGTGQSQSGVPCVLRGQLA